MPFLYFFEGIAFIFTTVWQLVSNAFSVFFGWLF